MISELESSPPDHLAPPTTNAILMTVRRELSARRRWVYRGMLLVIGIAMAALLSLWGTEPGPLPLRLHVTFATLATIHVGWIGVLLWILTRRNCPTVFDRIATSWMAVAACCLFLMVGITIAVLRNGDTSVFAVAITGAGMLIAALFLLRRAYATRSQLEGTLRQLEAAEVRGIQPPPMRQ